MKAVLSNRIFMEVTPEYQAELRKELSYTIEGYRKDEPPITIRNMSLVKTGLVTIPSGRVDLIPKGYEIVDKRVLNPVGFPEFQGTLRPSQQEIYDAFDDSAIINAWVSFGKTFTALAIAGKLEQKTLVVTHTIPLRNQWVREIEKVYGFTPGIIGSGKFDISTPIVVGNVQSLYKKMPQIHNLFGTVILDECLDYDSKITTREGQKSIGTIVNNEISTEVLSYNEESKSFEWKPILRFFKNKYDDLMIKFTFSNSSVLKCTMNHSVYSLNKGKVPAESLMEGDNIIVNKSFKSSQLLTEEAKPLILGMILGDGSLSTNNISCRLRITHGEAQLDYLNYKINLIKEAIPADLVTSKSGYKPENNIYACSSLSFYDLDDWRGQLYGTNSSKGTITKNIAESLTIDSWAIMYQDDGSISKKNNRIIFSFCELDEYSVTYLQESLNNLFKISSKQFVCSRGFRYLTLNVETSRIFIEAIAHLIHPCISYKKGNYCADINFVGSKPVKVFEDYSVQKIVDVSFEYATGGYKYNIEVADNHNYLSGHKLVGNCHHVSSPTFSRILDKCCARYKIGLSGTIQRKDGKHVVFRDYFGNKLYQPPKENYMIPEIHIYKSQTRLPDGASIPWAKRVNTIAYDEEYQHSVSMIAAAYAAKGHKVLVVSDRVGFLTNCAKLVGDNAVSVTGANGHEEREVLIQEIKDGRKEILFGTQSIFSEGISVDNLSCLILGTPINNEPLLTQLIGRVIREKKGKVRPVIIDINLKGSTAKRQAAERLGYYIKMGWEVKLL